MTSSSRARAFGFLLACTALAAASLDAACGAKPKSSASPASAEADSGGVDGGGDGADASIPTGTTGCAAYPSAVFCDDFEHETDASFFANYPATPYATDPQFVLPVVQTSPTAYSPTHVLHTDAEYVADAGNSGQRFSQIGRQLPTVLVSQSLSVGFSARVVSYTPVDGGYETGPSPNIQIAFDAVDGASVSCTVEFQGKDPSHYWVNMCGVLLDGGFPTAAVAFTLGAWQRFTVSASFAPGDAGVGTVTLAVDGAVVASEPMAGTGGASGTMYSGSFSLGSFAWEETPSMVMDFDDVVIEQR